ncbi:MAG: tRNA-guanine transglycosylase, partial [Patescibacteria group bacterium]
FDCVIPTREGRHGRLFMWRKKELTGKFYRAINITNQKWRADHTPINPNSDQPLLRHYTKAYLHHLFKTEEPLALRLSTLNNVEFYLELMCRIRQEIK